MKTLIKKVFKKFKKMEKEEKELSFKMYDDLRFSIFFNPRDLKYTLYIHFGEGRYRLDIINNRKIKELKDLLNSEFQEKYL